MCMGVTAGAYVLTLFAVYQLYTLSNVVNENHNIVLCFPLLLSPLSQIKYAERVQGLILVSPLCKTPSWTEWFVNKV